MSDAWDGRPENPERDGWHWLQGPREKAPEPFRWTAAGTDTVGPYTAMWWGTPWSVPAILAKDGWRYLGPALLPAQVAAAVEAEREACAQIADETDTGFFDARTFTAQKIAAAIRARGSSSALADALRQAEARGMREAARIAERDACGGECGFRGNAAAILAAADAKERGDE